MKEYKNIDRLFQENFKDLEIEPRKAVWNNIEAHLSGKKPSRILPLWQKISGIAIVFLLTFSLGFNFFKTSSKKIQISDSADQATRKSVNTVAINAPGEPTLTPVFKKETVSEKPAANTVKKEELPPSTGVIAGNILRELGEEELLISEEEKRVAEEHKVPKNLYANNFNDEALKKSETVVASANKKEKKTADKKWSVGPTISPVYFSSLKKGSPVSKDLQNNNLIGEEALSYGLKVDYKLSDKIKFQTGMNRVELGYTTQDVNAVISSSKSANHQIDSKYTGIHLSPAYSNERDVNASATYNKASVDGDLNQTFDYIEIPMEVKYNLFDSKVGLNVVGGFSTFILTNNSVNMILSDQITNIGKANNLNTFNFSGNVGIDLDYKITTDWYLNVSPMFKYQFNTFSHDAGNFRPYYFGVYSGINFRF